MIFHIVMLAELNPALHREAHKVLHRILGERKFSRGSEVLAFVELDDETGVGHPIVTGRQMVCPHKIADAEPPMRLQRGRDVAQRRLDLASFVSGEARSPAESMVDRATPEETLQQFTYPDLAFRTSLGMTSGRSRTSASVPVNRVREGVGDHDVSRHSRT